MVSCLAGTNGRKLVAVFKWLNIACITGISLVILFSIILFLFASLSVTVLQSTTREMAKEGIFAECERCPRAFNDRSAAMLTLFQMVIMRDSWGILGVPFNERHQGFLLITIALLLSLFITVLSLIIPLVWFVINWSIMKGLRKRLATLQPGTFCRITFGFKLRLLAGVVAKGVGVAWAAGISIVMLLSILFSFFATVFVSTARSSVHKMTSKGIFSECERCPRAFDDRSEALLTLFQTVIMGDSWGQLGTPLSEESMGFLCLSMALNLGIFVVICSVCLVLARVVIHWPIMKELTQQLVILEGALRAAKQKTITDAAAKVSVPTAFVVQGGEQYQPSSMGIFTAMESQTGPRWIYQNDQEHYLYFWAPFGRWRIGPDPTKGHGWVASVEKDIDSPSMISNWDIWDGDKWIHSAVTVAAQGVDVVPQEDH